jgi:hypothetical protein
MPSRILGFSTTIDWFLCYLATLFRPKMLYGVEKTGKININGEKEKVYLSLCLIN